MVIVYKSRHGTYLYCVGIVGWIFKQTIIWIEELPGHQEKKLSWWSTVVQPLQRNLTLLWSKKLFFFLIYIPYIIFWLKFRKILTKTLIRADCLMPKYVELSRDYAKMEWLGGLEWSSPCGLLSEKSFGSSCNGLFATGIWPIGGGEMGRRKIMKRAKIRLICIWQINNENKQWSYFVFADLQP